MSSTVSTTGGDRKVVVGPVLIPGRKYMLRLVRHRSVSLLALLMLIAIVGPPGLAGAAASGQEDDGSDDPNVIVDPDLLSPMQYRMIGPYRGGRSTAVTGVPSQPFTFYMGATGGGVWKSTNAGESWENVSDDFFGVGSIGAIEVAPSDPNVVYVGTGSACPRGNVSAGDGVYRSTDAGKTWKHLGLPDAGQVGRVRVHPSDPDTVFVAATGHIFGPNEDRGVYRSKDGGETWELVLHVSEKTGAVDLAMNPANPRVLFAAMWTAERKPWTMIDGSEESAVYRTTDGGDTWKKLGDGLPDGLLGRIGVTISPANPDRVWALITAPDGREGKGGVYRSEDGGDSWRRVSQEREIQTRGWYYTHIYADPSDENTVWSNNGGFLRSIDGGVTWGRVSTPHGDNHDVWINPEQPWMMVQGNDGGANVSVDGGKSWSNQLNQPTAEFYRVTVDNQFPYRVYGAQQDNSTITVPSRNSGGITPKQYWYSVAGAESGHISVDPNNPNRVFSGNYIGRIDSYDRATGYSRNVIIYPEMQDGTAVKDLKHRFQWNAPIVISRHDPQVVYHTSNFVHRTRDGGMSWDTISPDLTNNDAEKQPLPGGPVQHDHTGVEVYNTIFAFAESPYTGDELWAGADDGRIHVTRDGGTTWTDITPPQMPEDGTVNSIDLSRHAEGKAYVVAYRYRMDDFRPYAFRTSDWGASWDLLTDGSNGIPEDHPVRVVREDPDRAGLLYAGTEFAMFASFDDGAHWQSLQLNLPVTPVTDLVVHEQDLVVATQGRSFWILDDLTLLHQIEPADAEAAAKLYRPRDTVLMSPGRFRGGRAPENPPAGAVIHFALADKPEGDVRLEILDPQGDVIRVFSSEVKDEGGPGAGFFGRQRRPRGKTDPETGLELEALGASAGMNRHVWNLMYPGPVVAEGAIMSLGYTGGAYGPPGDYTVRLKVGEEEMAQTFAVIKDPRLVEVTEADLDARFELVTRVRDSITDAHDAVRALRSVRTQVKAVTVRAEKVAEGRTFATDGDGTVSGAEAVDASVESDGAVDAAAVKESADALLEGLAGVEEELIQTMNEAGQDPLNFPSKLDDQFAYLYGHVNGSYGRPTEGSYQRFDDLRGDLDPILERLQAMLDTDLGAFNELLAAQGLVGVVPIR